MYFQKQFFKLGQLLLYEENHGFYPVVLFTRGPSSFLRTIAAYLLGIFAFLNFEKINERAVFLKYLAILVFVLLFIKQTDVLLILSMPFFIVYITGKNTINNFLSSKVVYFLGSISYSLYVNHFLFIDSFAWIAKMLGINANNYLIISACYVAVGTLVFSTITYYAIEKPAMGYLKKLGERYIFIRKQGPALHESDLSTTQKD